MRLDAISPLGGTLFGAVFVVEGTVTGLEPVSAVELLVPFLVTPDLDAEEVTTWMVSVGESTVTIELGS